MRVMQDPQRFLTPEVRRLAQERFSTISGPIFFAQSEQDPSEYGLGDDLMIPDLKAAARL